MFNREAALDINYWFREILVVSVVQSSVPCEDILVRECFISEPMILDLLKPFLASFQQPDLHGFCEDVPWRSGVWFNPQIGMQVRVEGYLEGVYI